MCPFSPKTIQNLPTFTSKLRITNTIPCTIPNFLYHTPFLIHSTIGTLSMNKFPLDSASVLACAYQLKVRSKSPKNFEYWFCQQLMRRIRNDFIKQHFKNSPHFIYFLRHALGNTHQRKFS